MFQSKTAVLLATARKKVWYFEVVDETKGEKSMVCSVTFKCPVFIKGLLTPESVKFGDLHLAVKTFRESCITKALVEAEQPSLRKMHTLEKALACVQEMEGKSCDDALCIRELLIEEEVRYRAATRRTKNGNFEKFRSKRDGTVGNTYWENKLKVGYSDSESENEYEF
ncbi:hypothetical protein [Kurlavirus BKC-1]|nr:hypothetical protein [Kurlavirus BKC-1]